MNFLCLPSELISVQILPFLSLKDIARLDGSVANHANRKDWLLTLSTICNFRTKAYPIDAANLESLMWICSKNVAFGGLAVNRGTEDHMFARFLACEFDWSTISDISISSDSIGNNATRFFSALTGITHLEMRIDNLNIAQQLLATATGLKSLFFNTSSEVCALQGQHHTELEELYLSSWRWSNEVSIAQYISCAPKLRKIAGNLSDNILIALASSCTKLQELSASSMEAHPLSDAGLVAAAESCRDLRCLSLSRCHSVTENALLAVTGNCAQLEQLHMYSSSGATDRVFTALGTHCAQLETLWLTECDMSSITDSGVLAVAEGCPLLRSCALCKAKRITDAAVVAMATHCAHLQFLNVTECKLLTDASIITAFERCSELRFLHAVGCPRVTLACLAPLDGRPRELEPEEVELSWTLCPSDAEMDYMCSKYPFLDFK